MSRWERREDYKKDNQKDENGRYRYVGQWYALENHAERGKKLKWGYRLQQLLTLVLILAMGLTPAGPMVVAGIEGFNYVMLLYGLAFLAGIAAIHYTHKISGAGFCLPMHDSRYVDWHGICSMVCAIAGLALTVGQLIYLIGAAERKSWDVLLALQALLLAGVNGAAWFAQRKLQWEVLENGEK